MIVQVITLSYLIRVSLKIVKLTVTLKNKEDKEDNDVVYTSFRNEIIETIGKTETISMSECENLTKVKMKNHKKNISILQT